jgi:hypothetical protein
MRLGLTDCLMHWGNKPRVRGSLLVCGCVNECERCRLGKCELWGGLNSETLQYDDTRVLVLSIARAIFGTNVWINCTHSSRDSEYFSPSTSTVPSPINEGELSRS